MFTNVYILLYTHNICKHVNTQKTDCTHEVIDAPYLCQQKWQVFHFPSAPPIMLHSFLFYRNDFWQGWQWASFCFHPMVKSHLDMLFMTADAANHWVGRPVWGCCLFWVFQPIDFPCPSFPVILLVPPPLSNCLTLRWVAPGSFLKFHLCFLISTHFLGDLIQSLDFQYHHSCMMSPDDDNCPIYITSSHFHLNSILCFSATSQTPHIPYIQFTDWTVHLPHTVTSYCSVFCSFPFST